jgi:hypothetical protein
MGKEPVGRFGALTQKEALLLTVVWMVGGIATAVLRLANGESLLVSLLISSGFFVAAGLMFVAWRIAKSRAERNRS